MREDIQRLTAEMRAAIAEKLCVDLDLDEEDLRALLRDEILKEIEESVLGEADEILKERLTGEIKNEIYEEVHEDIYHECFDELMDHYRNEETFISQVKSEVRAELKQQVIDQLKAELRNEVLDSLKAEMRADASTISAMRNQLTDELYQEVRESLLRSRETARKPEV